MALLIAATRNFIEIALDTTFDLDLCNDLVTLGLIRNAEDGMRIRKMTFVPSFAGDGIIVRDGQNGPRIFSAVDTLGVWDLLKDEYREDGKIDRGKVMNPYIHASESIIAFDNNAFIIFEL